MWSDIWNVLYIELRIWNQVSYDHRSWTQFKQFRIEALKSQDFNGVWTCDLAIPVRRSNQLSYEATDVGSWSFVSWIKQNRYSKKKSVTEPAPKEITSAFKQLQIIITTVLLFLYPVIRASDNPLKAESFSCDLFRSPVWWLLQLTYVAWGVCQNKIVVLRL